MNMQFFAGCYVLAKIVFIFLRKMAG